MSPAVLAECRPNLKACYFFIKNFPNDGHFFLELEEQIISVRNSYKQLCIVLPPTLTLVAGSISGQTSTNCTLTFRTRIEAFNPTTNLDDRPIGFSPDFKVNDSVSLSCDFCSGTLTEARVFSRVLPLPSSDEPSGFFCHRHSEEPMSLDPKPTDFFYNYFFYKIHAKNFVFPLTDSKFRCPRCLELLGEVRGKCVKLWNSVVSFSTIENKEDYSIHKFLKSLVHFIKNLPVQMNKFVFLSSQGTSSQYTLLWIMDRALVILERPSRADCISGLEHHVNLEPKTVMKVLYSHDEQLTETASEWMKSFNTSLIPIHSRIESGFLKYLKHVGDSVPADCAVIDGMGVSYLDA